MTTLREAATQALEALDKATRYMSDADYKKLNQAIDDLRAALVEDAMQKFTDVSQEIEAALAEPMQFEDVVTHGSAWSKDGKRIDPMSVYAEPVQEPVAWQWLDTAHFRKKIPADATPAHWRPLYTAPPQRKPLSEEEIDAEWRKAASEEGFTTAQFVRNFARAIERAHGIT